MDAAASIPERWRRPTQWRRSLELVPYEAAVVRMRQDVAEIAAGEAERVWLLEHPALYTAGSSARDADLTGPGRLPVHRSGRGGQWTYHGPGQRVAYVMLDLTWRHGRVPARDLHLFVRGLEDWVIAALSRFGVRGERRQGRVGVWVADGVNEAKIAAVGVRVTRWVSWHGVSVNVAPDLADYSGIVPCGIREHGVTSLAALGVDAGMNEVDAALLANWEEIFGVAAMADGAAFTRPTA